MDSLCSLLHNIAFNDTLEVHIYVDASNRVHNILHDLLVEPFHRDEQHAVVFANHVEH